MFEAYMSRQNVLRIRQSVPEYADVFSDPALMEKKFNLFAGETDIPGINPHDEETIWAYVNMANEYLFQNHRPVRPEPMEQYSSVAVPVYNTEKYDPDVVEGFFRRGATERTPAEVEADREWMVKVQQARDERIRRIAEEPSGEPTSTSLQTTFTSMRPEVSLEDKNMTITLFR